MIVGKWFVGAGAGLAVGLNFKEANAIGVLMNCRGLMILVVALVGKQAGVITDPMQGAFVIGAIVTTLMTGPLVDVFLSKETVEAERKETMADSVAGMPAMTGGPRVLVVPGGVARLAAVADARPRARAGERAGRAVPRRRPRRARRATATTSDRSWTPSSPAPCAGRRAGPTCWPPRARTPRP